MVFVRFIASNGAAYNVPLIKRKGFHELGEEGGTVTMIRGGSLAIRALSVLVVVTAVGLFATTISSGAAEQAPSTKDIRAVLTSRAQVPAPSVEAVRAQGLFLATLRGKRLRWRLTFHGLTSAATAAYLRVGRPGVRGPIVKKLCAPCRFGSSGRATLTLAVARKVLMRLVFVEIQTPQNPRGEIRGQLAVGLVPTLEILEPRDGEEIVLPARVRYAVTGFSIGPGVGTIVAWVQGTQDPTRVELELNEVEGLADLPNNPVLAGQRDLTFALVQGDGTVLRSRAASVTLYDLTIIGRR
jgi:hypothetical protein